MKKLMVMLVALLGFSLIAVAAEDATGNWKGTLDTPNGAMTLTFALKADAGKLTGTMGSDMMGNLPISEGKVDGDKITFSVTGQMGVIHVTGTVSGDTLKMNVSVGDGQFAFDISAARVKA